MSYHYPEKLNELIDHLSALPGVGKRTAERMALSFLKWDDGALQKFGKTISELPETVAFCPICGNYADIGTSCYICTQSNRDRTTICVIETPEQIKNIEQSGLYRGLYHVLGGKLSPLQGKGEETLAIELLETRLQKGVVKEIILALSQDIEGQATAVFLSKILKPYGVQVTKLAQGVPVGSDISYVDAATIGIALNARITL
jgi:recombination protein RecR